jgi:hypothetical protein
MCLNIVSTDELVKLGIVDGVTGTYFRLTPLPFLALQPYFPALEITTYDFHPVNTRAILYCYPLVSCM